VNVGTVCAVVVAAFAARKLVDVLQMIRTGLPGISHHHLTVLVSESECGRGCAISRHALILLSDQRVSIRSLNRNNQYGIGRFSQIALVKKATTAMQILVRACGTPVCREPLDAEWLSTVRDLLGAS
jgi:hypothetical protein